MSMCRSSRIKTFRFHGKTQWRMFGDFPAAMLFPLWRAPTWRLHKSLHTSQVAKQAGTYPGFRSIKRQGVFVLSSRWDASPSQGYPTPALSSRYPFIHLGVERQSERTRTTRSRDERTNHEATAPPTEKLSFLWQNSMTGVFSICLFAIS